MRDLAFSASRRDRRTMPAMLVAILSLFALVIAGSPAAAAGAAQGESDSTAAASEGEDAPRQDGARDSAAANEESRGESGTEKPRRQGRDDQDSGEQDDAGDERDERAEEPGEQDDAADERDERAEEPGEQDDAADERGERAEEPGEQDDAADERGERADEPGEPDEAANDDQGQQPDETQGTPPSEVCDELQFLTKFEGSFDSTDVGETFGPQEGVTLTVTQTKDGGEALAVSYTTETPVDRVVLKAGTDLVVQDGDELESGSIASRNDKAVSNIVFCFDGETGDDTTGDDTAGDDTAGDDVAGDDTAGDDVAGDDTAGDQEVGDDIAAPGDEGQVLGETLESDDDEAAAPADDTQVLGETVERDDVVAAAPEADAAADVRAGQLPRGGADPLLPAAFAIALMAIGALLLRREQHARTTV